MKKKIMDALQQKYKNLGLENEVFERVASSVETFITDETLDAFVANAEGMLKSYQSMGDKHRAALADAKKKQDEIQAQLDEALKKVNDIERTVITLFYLEDQPIKKICQITGMPDGTVKSHLARAKAKMAKLLRH